MPESSARRTGTRSAGSPPQAPDGTFERAPSRPASIQTQLAIGISVIQFLGLLIALAGYLSLRTLQGGIQTTLQQANSIRESSLQVENLFLLARQDEAAFMDAWRTTGSEALAGDEVVSNQENLSAAQRELESLGSLAQAASDPELRTLQADIDALAPQLDAYQTAFLTTHTHIQERSRAGGLDSAMRGELEWLEAALSDLPSGDTHFRELILRIRATEQAYYSTKRQEYVDTLHLRVADLVADIEATDWSAPALAQAPSSGSTQSEALLINHANTYLGLFDRVVLMDRQIDVNTVIFREVTSDVNQITDRIAQRSEAGLARAEAQLAAIVRRATYLLAAAAVVGLALGSVVAMAIGQRIVGPLRLLSRAAERLGAGELHAPFSESGSRAVVESSIEFATLADAFTTMAGRLRELIGSLEQRVADRTRSLRAAAEVSQATTSAMGADPDELLSQVADLVRDRFNLYYVGLFLTESDPRSAVQSAVLRAGTGEAGKQMMAAGHRLRVGGESMIGRCIADSQAHIELDTSSGETRFANPLLPETRSELALPLRSRGRVIGAMTVQSTAREAFDEADIAAMQTMADQVAVAIDNAQLFAGTQETLAEMAATQRQYLGKAWGEYMAASGTARYETGSTRGTAAGEIRQALTTRQAMALNPPDYSAMIVPIMLRGQVIGVLRVQDDQPGRQWTADEMALAESVGERLGLAADNLRLLDETQRRAAQEQMAREITDKMRRAISWDELMQITIHELASALDASESFVQWTALPSSDALPSTGGLSSAAVPGE